MRKILKNVKTKDNCSGKGPMYVFYKNEETDQIWWVDDPEREGFFLFSFDRSKVFNLFSDYPWKLSAEQKEIFDRENPFWVNFFKDRSER